MKEALALLTSLVTLVGLIVHCLRDKAEFRRMKNDRG